MRHTLFLQPPSPLLRLLVLAAVSLGLLFFDLHSDRIEAVKSSLSTLLLPLQKMGDLPAQGKDWYAKTVTNRATLLEENQALKEKNLQLSARLQKLEALKVENIRLKDLLNSSVELDTELVSARLLAVNLNPFQQKMLVDKGEKDNIRTGYPVIDDLGLMGQIIQTHPFHAEVMLISDPEHATPVQVMRNGIRSVAVGLGRPDMLSLLYVPVNTDIKINDTLITSGLGGRFPPDYPVAVITHINRATRNSFAEVKAEPLARLNRSRDVLLVINSIPANNSSRTDAAPPELENKTSAPNNEANNEAVDTVNESEN